MIDITRRNLCLTGLMAGATVMVPRPMQAARRSDLSSLEQFLLIKGSLDGKLVIAGLNGIYHAIDGGRTTPLLGLQSVSFSLYSPNEDGTFRQRTGEAEYYTDLASGKIIYKWTNPLTGAELTLADRGRNVTEFTLHPNLSVTLGKNANFRQSITSIARQGDDLWYEEQSTYVPSDPKQGSASTEFVTYHARRSDLAAPSGRRVPAQVGYTVLSAWRPWMQMGAWPGSVLLRGKGQAHITMQDLPMQWVARTREYWPDLLDSPESVLRNYRPKV